MLFALIHPVPQPDAVGLGLIAVVQTARAAGWQAHLYQRDDPIPRRPDLIGFSLYTPLRFPGLPAWLRRHDLAPRAADRPPTDPLVIAGGPAVASPGPILPFVDALVMGDAEVTLPAILRAVETSPASAKKGAALDRIAALPAVYVPGRSTRPARWLTTPHAAAVRQGSRILAARGCRYSCPFCQVSPLHAPYRPVPHADLVHAINAVDGRVSLSAAAISHHPHVLDLLALLADQNRYLNSVNVCHRDLAPDLIQALAHVSGRIGFGVEGVSARLRRAAGKPISDRALETLLLELLRRFGVVGIYVIVGLPGETEADQDDLLALLHRVLDRRDYCWNGGHPGRLQITSTPFQALPHTRWEREPAPPGHLITRWRAEMRRMRERYEYFFAQNVKTPPSADVVFGLHRAGPEWAPVIEQLGATRRRSTWSAWRRGKFLRLAQERGLTLDLDRLTGPLPWADYCATP